MTDSRVELPASTVARRAATDDVVKALRDSIDSKLGESGKEVLGEDTTFILTGSAGRGEMTEGSDVDGYVIRLDRPLDSDHDDALLRATIAALAEQDLPPLDREGAFLAMKRASALVDCLGSAEDDHSNALTIRMLFLLESRPLVGETAYDAVYRRVRAAYRGTATGHEDDFLPFFLVNDIIRYWRTVLLNHEDRLRTKRFELAEEGLEGTKLSARLLAHRRYRSQKLRFPRCATCFSALAYLLALAPGDDDSVSPEEEEEMFLRSPLERLRGVADKQPTVTDRVQTLVDLYARYLDRSMGDKLALIDRFEHDSDFASVVSSDGQRFTEEMFLLIQDLGQGNRLHRQMLI